MRISLSSSHRSFSATAEQSLLDAALGASLNLPHSCKGGNCGACRARLLQGEVYYLMDGPWDCRTPRSPRVSCCCVRHARAADLVIETFEPTAPEDAVIKRLPARIERMVPLAHDVMGLHLRLPAAEPFTFAAGQYIDILLSGGRRRSFSIASPPHDSRLLELHVRRVAGGEFSERLFAHATSSTLLHIEGPLGQFVYRAAGASAEDAPNAPAAPMLLVGGGTGLAPLLSILRHVWKTGSSATSPCTGGCAASATCTRRPCSKA